MRLVILIFVSLLFGVSSIYAQSITVGTYNIRYKNTADSINGNPWCQRCDVICGMINFHALEIFGAQEVLHEQLLDMLQRLSGYGYVGVGRDDGKTKGEYAPIFYRKDKFKVLDSGNFWLSEDTSYPNKGWDAALPRICTWAKFRVKDSGFEFLFLNLHMDHVGVEARKNSAKLVLERITQFTDSLPVVLTGDFNVDQYSPNYKILVESDLLKDSYKVANIRYALNGTFNDFKSESMTTSRIDHVFVSAGFKVSRYGVLTDTYRVFNGDSISEGSDNFPNEVTYNNCVARVPSDHFPVKVELIYE
ncbi:endonuclease/exonuclease/phosphatase family protein [Plebeiibacterium sediminum]|uniref:Endonuclease/exonuclease/phosphatase family protein n=1 Tax=Plebeiibacterium sediminum TaxID=2992112 RepID=A0AAE3M6D5_9BACT|nr:endonuclease/exonuclease/phosphatase family protein [Plebeiobacterium sediminum]MCW3787942.1 endonuclease/exonuclease/phosphatase family protein [Plebeiobacterium sediminum]